MNIRRELTEKGQVFVRDCRFRRLHSLAAVLTFLRQQVLCAMLAPLAPTTDICMAHVRILLFAPC